MQVSPDVKAISASESGELWAVLDRVVPDSVIPGLVDVLVGPGSIPGTATSGLSLASNARGVLARRSGVTPELVTGTGWDIALGVSQTKYLHLNEKLNIIWEWEGIYNMYMVVMDYLWLTWPHGLVTCSTQCHL